ncbi:MAG: M23 family metallopeptidase [Anaerorhabdus sp.]
MKKIGILFGGIFIGSAVLLMPIVAAISAVGTPFRVVGDFFEEAFLGEIEITELYDLIDSFIETPEATELFNEEYLPHIMAEKQITMPLNYIFIPLVIVGTEEATEADILTLINAAKKEIIEYKLVFDEYGNPVWNEYGEQVVEIEVRYELYSVEEYVDNLSKLGTYDEIFKIATQEEFAEFISYFNGLGVYRRSVNGDDRFIYPFTTKADVTAEMGWYSPFGTLMWHDAIDLAFPKPNDCGVPIYSVSDGVVIAVQHTDGANIANSVTVDAGDGIVIKYVHMADKYTLGVGTLVSRGDYIGLIGSTGISTACHLHLNFKVNGKTVNPRDFIDFDNPQY